jgi:enamine deaminase RidA (YjgF/YER057c/UK114 family)
MMRVQVGVLFGLVAMSLGAAANPEFFDEGPMAGRGYPFSESARVGDILFISGQVGVDENNELVEGGIVGETRQIMSNIGGALERPRPGLLRCREVHRVSGGRGRVGQVQYHLHELL